MRGKSPLALILPGSGWALQLQLIDFAGATA
jgi:hypothetical protein